MTKTKKRIIIGLTSFVILLGALLYSSYKRMEYNSMIECTLEWGRLAPFPDPVEDFTITTEGSMFTRAFRASFTASPEVIQKWINDSPGMRNLQPTQPSPHIRRFDIDPGGGAQHAEVEIDDASNTVRVYVYWS